MSKKAPLVATRKNVKAQIKVDNPVRGIDSSIIQFSATWGTAWLLRSTKWASWTCCCCVNMSGKRPGQGVPRSRRRDDDIDVEDFPDPPHIAQSSKRRRTSGGLRSVQIQYDGSRVGISKPPMLKPPYS